MKPVVKGLLIGCGVLVVIGTIGVGGLVWFLNANKDKLIAQGKAVESEGTKFGKDVTEPKCVDEALSRYMKDSGITGTIQSSIWLDGCLTSSAFTDGFCDGVPSDDEITRTVVWRNEQCQKHGIGGQCGNVLAAVQKYCYSPVRARKKP
jgi:hypothetical protein